MLSVLIPVYNYDVSKLIHQLQDLCERAGITYEIICLDDGSESGYQELYKNIHAGDHVKWITALINKGRSASRNALALLSSYEYLLFLDCDVLIPNSEFINQYIGLFKSKVQVVYGSCIYSKQIPAEPHLKLHWLYGSKKENPVLSQRIKYPYDSFHTVNFMVRKDIMLAHPFEEALSKYGYEDSLWAQVLKQHGIPITHIDNPVLHIGIHSSKLFLRKTAQAIHNLLFLERHKHNIKTKLTDAFYKLRAYGIHDIALRLYQKNERRIVRNLLSDHPSLLLLSLYKLGLFLRFSHRFEKRAVNKKKMIYR